MLQLRATRQRLFLSAEELAHRAGISVFTVNRIENGHSRAKFSTIQKLARALGVSPEQLTQEAAPPRDDQQGEG